MTAADFRRIALSLDGVEEVAPAGLAAFRVAGVRFSLLATQSAGYGNLTLTLERNCSTPIAQRFLKPSPRSRPITTALPGRLFPSMTPSSFSCGLMASKAGRN
jgi:hypothetical protein